MRQQLVNSPETKAWLLPSYNETTNGLSRQFLLEYTDSTDGGEQ
jgi:hypothetical protein